MYVATHAMSDTPPSPPLELASLEQIYEELERRYECVVVGIRAKTKVGRSESRVMTRFSGGALECLGMATVLKAKMSRHCVGIRRFDEGPG